MAIKVNFTGVNDEDVGSGGGGVPPGKYLCRVGESQERVTGTGAAYFNYKLTVIEGEHEGGVVGFDKLFFHTDGAVKRAKFVLRRMGFDVDAGDLSIEAEELNGRAVMVTSQLAPKCPDCKWDVKPVEKDAESGKTVYRCQKAECGWQGIEFRPFTEPKFNGYEVAEGVAAAPAKASGPGAKVEPDTKEIPF